LKLSRDLEPELTELRDRAVLQAYLESAVNTRFRRPLRDLRTALCGLGMDTAFATDNTKFEFQPHSVRRAEYFLAGMWLPDQVPSRSLCSH
jgi:hypothetical protein